MLRFCTALAIATLLLSSTSQALEMELGTYAGHRFINGPNPREATPVFDSTTGATVRAFSSTALNSIFGDTTTLTGTGVLDELSFTLFNSTGGGANTNPYTGGDVTISFFNSNFPTSPGTLIASANFTIDLTAAPLAPGFFTILTATGLSGLGVNLGTTSVVTTQQLGVVNGGTIRMGVASLTPVAVGSSDPTMYIDSATVGPAGFYNITSGGAPVDFAVGYKISIVPEPASMGLVGLGAALLALVRRRS
jgi:PEP-CTERM motif